MSKKETICPPKNIKIEVKVTPEEFIKRHDVFMSTLPVFTT